MIKVTISGFPMVTASDFVAFITGSSAVLAVHFGYSHYDESWITFFESSSDPHQLTVYLNHSESI